MATPCDYCLFGRNRSAESLRDALRDFWRELYRRDPDGVRGRARPYIGLLAFPVFISTDGRRTPAHFQLDEDLWAVLGSPNKQTLEATCQDVLQRMGRVRSDFVIYDFPDAPLLPEDSRYAALVHEFKQLQAMHQEVRLALKNPAAVPKALFALDLRRTTSPVGAFLRIRSSFLSRQPGHSSNPQSTNRPP